MRYSSTKNSDEELVPVASETRSCSTSASASSRSNATMPTFEGDKCREFDLDETPELLAATRKKKGSNPILPNGIGAMGTKSARVIANAPIYCLHEHLQTSLLQSVGLVLAREGADLAAVEETSKCSQDGYESKSLKSSSLKKLKLEDLPCVDKADEGI